MKKRKRSSRETKSGGVRRQPGADSENPLVIAFATRLRAWRMANGLRLSDVATDLDVSSAIVCEWELGRRFPSIDHLWAIARHTGIPASRLLSPYAG